MIHILTFLLALLVVFCWNYILPIHGFGILLQRDCSDNHQNCQVEDALNSGKLVVFGSSEIANADMLKQKYGAINFFARHNKSILYNAAYGYESLGMLSQILAYYNTNVQQNARMVILLSPMSFYDHDRSQSLTIYAKFIKNYELKKLLFLSDSTTRPYKNYVIDALKNRYKMHIPFIRRNIYRESEMLPVKQYLYDFHPMTKADYDKYFLDASAIEKNLDTNNPWGVHNQYFRKGKKYLSAHNIRRGMRNQDIFKKKEYLDTIMLIKFLSNLKIKPLFIMQDDLGYDFDKANKDRKLLLPLLNKIKDIMKENRMGYLDMWTYKKSDVVLGKLVDRFHTGNVGWVMINQKIMDYFSQKGFKKR